MRPGLGNRAQSSILGTVRTALTIFVVLAMLGTLGALFAGLFGLVRDPDPARSNRLMRWRVVLQATALVLFVLLMSLLRS